MRTVTRRPVPPTATHRLSVVRTVLRPDELAEARCLSALAAAEIAGDVA